jgi:HK97 family phage portal protein
MVGDPASIVIADTYLKGIRDFDVQKAYKAMLKGADQIENNPLRPGLKDYIEKGYNLNPHVYACINYITKAIQKIPFDVYEVVDEKSYKRSLSLKSYSVEKSDHFSTKALQLTTNEQLRQILKTPNENETWESFIEQSIGYKLLTGNNYIYGLTPKGFKNITKLYNIPSQLVTIKLGDVMQPVKKYNIGFGNNINWYLDPETVLHRKYWNPSFSEETMNVYGLSPMASLKNVVLRTNEAKAASHAMFENGIPAGVLSNESGISMTPEDLKIMEAQFRNKFGKGKNANKLIFSSQKLGWQSLGMSSVDMQIIEAEKADLRDVCRVFGVPSVLINDNEQSTYSNVLEAEKRFWSNTALPIMDSLVTDLNRFLLNSYSLSDGKKYVIDYDVKAIPALQDDTDKISARLLTEMERGVWTPNEVRMMLDKPIGDAPHLNEYFMASNLIKINNDLQA